MTTFQEHAELHTVEPEKKAKHCDPCGKVFVTEENYFDHYMKAHVKETDQCDYKLSRKNLLVEPGLSDHVENSDGTIVETLMSEVPNMGHRSILETLAILKLKVPDVQAYLIFVAFFYICTFRGQTNITLKSA